MSEEFLRPFFSVTDSKEATIPDIFAEDPYQCARMPIPSENHQNPTYVLTFYCREKEIESINKSTGIRERQLIPGRYLVGSPFPTVLYGFLRSSVHVLRNKIDKLGRSFQIENVNLDNFSIKNEQWKESMEQQAQEIRMEEYVQRSVRITSPYVRSNAAFSMEARSSYSVSRSHLRNRRKKLKLSNGDEYDSDDGCTHFRCWPSSRR